MRVFIHNEGRDNIYIALTTIYRDLILDNIESWRDTSQARSHSAEKLTQEWAEGTVCSHRNFQ